MLYRIDTFTVPEEARREFAARSVRIIALLRTQPGFVRDHWFEKISGAGAVNVVTLVAWQDVQSIEAAGRTVRALNACDGFDATAFAREHGIIESKAVYEERGQPEVA